MAGKNSTFVNNAPPSVDADWLNLIQQEQNNFIRGSGQIPSDAINNQQAISASRFAANNFYTDSGTANAYVLTLAASMTNPVSATEGYFPGMTIRFRAGNANTGASTVNINSAGVRSIKQTDGTTDPTAGMISTTVDTVARYDGTVFVIQGTASQYNVGTSSGQVPLIGTPSATPSFAGLAALATTPELDAAVNSQKIITPSVFAASKFNAINLVSSQTAVNAASIIFTGLSSAYSVYEFEFINVWPTVNGVGLVMQFSTDNGSNWQNTNYLSDGILDTTAGSAVESLNNARGPNLSLGDQYPNNNISSNATLGGLTGWAKVYNPSSSVHKLFHFRTVNIMSSDGTTLGNAQGYGIWRNTTPVNAVRFIFKTANSDTNNGNINGTIKMRGLL